MTRQRSGAGNQWTAPTVDIIRGLTVALKDALELAREVSEHGVDPRLVGNLREFVESRLPEIDAALARLSEGSDLDNGRAEPEAESRVNGSNRGQKKLDTQLFADAFGTTPIGVAVENLEGQPIFVNPALCSMLGFTEEELNKKHCVDFSPAEDAEKDWALFQQLLAGAIERYQIEKRYFRRDRSVVWGRLSVSLLNRRSSPLVLAMVEDITEKRKQQAALSNLSQRLIVAQEEERARLARELHDDITQRLALLAIEIDEIPKNGFAGDSKLGSVTRDLSTKVAEIMRDLRSLSHELDSSKLTYLGLTGGLKSWCRDFGRRSGFEIGFAGPELPTSLNPEISLCLFRVLQEALQNAAKHSGAKQIDVELLEGSDVIELIVHDCGSGFDVGTAVQARGLGLISMRERVRLVGGTIVINSIPKAGTSIHVRVPFERELEPQKLFSD